MRHECAPGSPQDWLSRANGKLLLARQPLPEGGYWEDLCYMAQQAAELAVKAVYQAKDWRFAFVHDLAQLLDGLEENGAAIPENVREAEKLTLYATQMRYPGASGFTLEKDYTRMLAIAEVVVAWAESIVES
jgi:HEPN domain-containing protein